MVPRVPHHVAQMRETQPEVLRLAGIRQANEQVRDHFVLVAEQRAVAMARLADATSPGRRVRC